MTNMIPTYQEPLSTLSLEKGLEADQFFHFHMTPRSPGSRQVLRHLRIDGEHVERVRFRLPPGPDEWLCPYFEPATRTLRFRKQDGGDLQHVVDISTIAQCKDFRHLLSLAQAEGLLEKVPGVSQAYW